MKMLIEGMEITTNTLSDLLNLPVKLIRITPEGVSLEFDRVTEADITADHIAVIKDIYGGQSVELITEDSK